MGIPLAPQLPYNHWIEYESTPKTQWGWVACASRCSQHGYIDHWLSLGFQGSRRLGLGKQRTHDTHSCVEIRLPSFLNHSSTSWWIKHVKTSEKIQHSKPPMFDLWIHQSRSITTGWCHPVMWTLAHTPNELVRYILLYLLYHKHRISPLKWDERRHLSYLGGPIHVWYDICTHRHTHTHLALKSPYTMVPYNVGTPIDSWVGEHNSNNYDLWYLWLWLSWDLQTHL